MKNILLLLSFSLLFHGPIKAQCSPPEDVILIIDELFQTCALIWSIPNSTCPILYYDVHYATQPITDPGNPPPGEILSNVSFNQLDLPYGTSSAWVRSVCDCEPLGDPDGLGDSESLWIEATVCYYIPVFPDQGLSCPGPSVEIAESSQCPNFISASLDFLSIFEFEGAVNVSCTGQTEYVLWRSFIAPSSGEIEVSISAFSWSNFGFLIKEECGGTEVYCRAQIDGDETDLVTGLTPGLSYTIGSWNNNYPYMTGGGGGICPGTDYNGTSNTLKLCSPEATCPAPFNISTSDITDQSAFIQWNGNGSSEWSMEYGPSGFTLGEGMVITNITESAFLIEGLDSGSEYDFYLNADCGASGQSDAIGPYSFMTEPSIWITSEAGSGSVFCCDSYSIPESFEAEGFCGDMEYSFSDEQIGSGCDYTLYRTITATDSCGHSISSAYELTVQDNDIPCGCGSISTFNENYNSDLVAIDGDWAAYKSGIDHQILHREDGLWTEHSEFQLNGSPFFWTLHIEDSILLANNEVFRLNDDEWSYETSLVPSTASGNITTVAIENGDVFILNNGFLTVFEETNGIWEETASILQEGRSIDVSGDVMGIGIFSQDTIGAVYRMVGGEWTFEQNIIGIAEGLGNGQGVACTISGNNLAIGTAYFGGIHTYHYLDGIWGPVRFIENPFLASDFGYYSNFGAHMDMEGELLVVGDEMNQVNGNFSGSVVVLEWESGDWIPQRNIVPVNSGTNHRFGGAIDVDDEGQMIVGIDDTQWIGGGLYSYSGQIYIMGCLGEEMLGCPITGSEGGVLECGEALPEPEFELDSSWDDDYEVTIEIDGEGDSCGDTVIRTITVEDVTGNIGSLVQTYYYVDNTAPFLSIAADITLECGEPLPEPEFTSEDNCGAVSVTIDEMFSPSCGEAGVLTRVFTAEDDCGNSSVDTQVLTLVDSTPPLLECPSALTAEVDENGDFLLPSYLGLLSIIEDCSLPLNLSQDPAPNSILGVVDQSITLSGTDLCGNVGLCEVTLSIMGPNSLSINLLKHIEIYPVPASDELTIRLPSHDHSIGFELRDATGRVAIQGRLSDDMNLLNLSDTPSGIYSLIIMDMDLENQRNFKISILH